MRIFGIVRNAANLILARYADDDLKQPNLTNKGNIAVEQILSGPLGLVPTVADTDDNSVAAGQTVPLNIAENYVYSPPAVAWVRMNTLSDSLDGQASSSNLLGTVARLQAINLGGTFDNARSYGNQTDTGPSLSLGVLTTNSHTRLFNGALFVRARGASAVVQAAVNALGSTVTSKEGNWAIQSDPAAATQATITRAAGAAGVRHVCTSITATFSAGATAGAATKVYLRDGLTGAGAILWSGSLAVPIGSSDSITMSGLSIVGAAATAMTLEFAAAGALTTLQNVSLTGYTAS